MSASWAVFWIGAAFCGGFGCGAIVVALASLKDAERGKRRRYIV